MNSPAKEYLELQKISNSCYLVCCIGNKKVLGEFYQEVDGFFVFEPRYKQGDGFWPDYLLEEILIKLKELNRPWAEIIDNDPTFKEDNSSKIEGWDG